MRTAQQQERKWQQAALTTGVGLIPILLAALVGYLLAVLDWWPVFRALIAAAVPFLVMAGVMAAGKGRGRGLALALTLVLWALAAFGVWSLLGRLSGPA